MSTWEWAGVFSSQVYSPLVYFTGDEEEIHPGGHSGPSPGQGHGHHHKPPPFYFEYPEDRRKRLLEELQEKEKLKVDAIQDLEVKKATKTVIRNKIVDKSSKILDDDDIIAVILMMT